MERQIVLDTLAATLNPNLDTRKQGEAQLHEFEKQPGFTVYCLELAVDPSIAQSQRSSAAVFFKNRIGNFWNSGKDRAINEQEQEQIKEKLIGALLKAYNDNHIRPQLTFSLRTILIRGYWSLHESIVQLISSKSQPDHLLTGLVLLFEATRSLRWSSSDRTLIDSYISQTFPLLEPLALEVLNNNDFQSGHVLYLILKIFKFCALNTLPQYLYDPNKLSTWITIHLATVQRENSEKVLELEPADRQLDSRIKAFKWGFSNLHKFYQRYGTPTSKSSSPEFIEYFNKTYVSEILKIYFGIVEKWSAGFWLSDSSLFHLIAFFEKCFMTPAWDLIKDHYDAILRHLLFPSLCQENLELYEDDPEEYIRRYFDVNRETNTADVAAVDALFVTVHHRFEVLPIILNLLNEIFNTYSRDQSLSNALKAEGGLRILGSISISLEKENSPVKDQIDEIIGGLIAPQLTSSYEFLRARACDTISIFSREYRDKNILSTVFQGVYENFKNDDSLPIQISAADALRVLVSDKLVMDAISQDIPIIMQKLLHISRTYELDMIGEVMETFVEVFSTELEPFANDLGSSLCDQFLRTATEFLESTSNDNGRSSSSEADKEYQAVGYLNTMSTMTLTMNKVNLETIFAPAVKFVLNNAAIAFLGEAMELLESMTTRTKQITPVVWDLFKEALDSFQTYAVEYFEYYIPFFENIITYGFRGLNSSSPQVVLLNDVVKELVQSDVDFDNEGALELIEYTTLVLGEFNRNFSSVLEIFKTNEDISHVAIVKVLLASLFIDPIQTLQALESSKETFRIFEIWFTLSQYLENIYGLKLQILALLSVLSLPEIPASLKEFVPQLSNKLAFSIEKVPDAIKRRLESLSGTGIISNSGNEDEYFEDDDDAFKDTPLDQVDILNETKSRLSVIQNNLQERYQIIFGSLDQQRLQIVNQILSS